MDTTWIISLVLAVLLLQGYCQVKLLKSHMFDKERKRLNSILLWVLPVVWAIVLLPMLHKSKYPAAIKKHRKRKGSSVEGGFDTGFGE